MEVIINVEVVVKINNQIIVDCSSPGLGGNLGAASGGGLSGPNWDL